MPKQSLKTAGIVAAHNQIGLGITGDGVLPLSPWWDGVNFQRHQFFHAKSFTATATAESVFFNATPDGVVTNVTNPKTIVGGESAFWMNHLMVDIQPGYTADGTATATTEPGAATVNPMTMVNDYNALLRHGILRIKVGKLERIYRGLHNFPFGGGVSADVALENTNSTVVNTIANLNNGVPLNSNKFCFTPPWAIYPDDAVEVAIRWPFARNLVAGVTICVYLEGVLTEVQ